MGFEVFCKLRLYVLREPLLGVSFPVVRGPGGLLLAAAGIRGARGRGRG